MSAADDERTKRLFISALSSSLGLEQSYAAQDGIAVNPTGQYQVIGPPGVSVEGRPVSTAQSQAFLGVPPLYLLLGGLVIYLALKG